MSAKEYLQQLKRLDTVINQKIEELKGLRSTIYGVGSIDYSKERVQTSQSANSPFVKTADRIADLETEINQEIDSFIDEKHKIINQIQGLRNINHINLLYKRYVEFKNLEVIAVEMNFTYQYTRRLHGTALQDFENTYKEATFFILKAT